MQLYVTGLASGYEPEHVARLFFSAAQLVKRWPSARLEPNAVVVKLSRRRMLCGIRQNGLAAVRTMPRPADDKQTEYELSKLLYHLLCEATNRRPPWGMLTGVRPVRIVHDMRRTGHSDAEIEHWFRQKYFVSQPKYALARAVAQVQHPVLEQAARLRRPYSLYLSIPFCPSRCSYCSFVSRSTAESGKLIAPYVEKLCEELRDIAALAARCSLQLVSVYIGGGTPTAISAPQLRALMETVRACFPMDTVQEYTVEAGRPDCTTPEKLQIIKEYGATRISINPQTLSDAVLQNIGRRHTAQDILDCFAAARAAGHGNINMDLIAGLPGDDLAGFQRSLAGVMALSPENITVHTLTLKRASNLVIEHADSANGDVAAMVEKSQEMLADSYEPYYLYRQKGTLGNLENTGYTKPGFAGLYNIYIMEEVHTILSAGAGGSTKLVQPVSGQISRIFNHKYPLEYIERFDVVRERKKGVEKFYGQFPDLDSEAAR
ncbi:MAG: coproporphyrinogen dehydrogenase HemZ [Ruthenibacterium sp.]